MRCSTVVQAVDCVEICCSTARVLTLLSTADGRPAGGGDVAVSGPHLECAVSECLEQVAGGDGGGEASGAGDAACVQPHLQQPLRAGVELVARRDSVGKASRAGDVTLSSTVSICAPTLG